MLDVHNHIRPYGQTNLFINSITIAILLLVQPILAAAENNTFESDELYSSEEYDSEDYEDDAKLDIRPLRDSRKLVVSPNTASTTDLSLQTTPATTTIEFSEPVTSEEIYTGTFKYVHNRADFNHSLYTLPTVIGTLFTVNIDEWKRAHHEPTPGRPVKLLDPNMINLFAPRSNYTSLRDYHRFVHWANRQYRMNHSGGSTTPSWGRSTFTLYPRQFQNDTGFQEYMYKNWMNNSRGDHRSGRRRYMNGSYHARSWIDKIASREFRAKPWRNKNVTEYREYGRDRKRGPRYWSPDRNETASRWSEQRSWRRRPYYPEGNDTRDFMSRPWKRRPYYLPEDGNETISGEWRGRRPYYPPPHRGEFYHDLEGNRTEPTEFEDRQWRESRPYPRREPPPWAFRDQRPPPWVDRLDRREFGPPRRSDFGAREWYDRRDSREFEPPRRDSREFGSPRRDSREFGPPRRDSGEFAPRRHDSREFKPPRRGSEEFDSRYESREPGPRPSVDVLKAENKSTSREIDERPLSHRKEIEDVQPRDRDSDDQRYSTRRAKSDDKWSREKDFDDRRPLRSKQEFEDRRPMRDRERFDDGPSRDKGFDERRLSQNRGRFDDRSPKDRDSGERKFSQDRGRFDYRYSKDKYVADRRPSRDKERFDDRPPRVRDSDEQKPFKDKQRFDDKSQKDRGSDEQRLSHDRQESDAKPSDESKVVDKFPSEEFHSRSSKKVIDSRESYRGSTRDYDSRRRTDQFLSIKRRDKDFWDKNKDTEETKRTSVDTFALQAQMYRRRIEQRRDKELQLIEKKRKMFWKPTDSNEATAPFITTTTTIMTTTRRSYNKLGKLFAKQSQAPDLIDEETLETPDHANEESTTPFEDEYMREWAMREEEAEKISTRLYDWITKNRDEGSTKAQSDDEKNLKEPKDNAKGGAIKSMPKGKKKMTNVKKGNKNKNKKSKKG